jgi:ferredoxin
MFELQEKGVVRVLMPTPPEELRAAVEEAVAGCPRAAIRIVDD